MSDILEQFVRSAGEWLRGEGPRHEIVISTRIRLARNLRGYHFLTQADDTMREEIAEAVNGALDRSRHFTGFHRLDIQQLDELDRHLLVERHLISRQHADGRGTRQLVVAPDEAVAVMVNEEDHLRIQVMRSGLQFEAAWRQIDAIDDAIEEALDYAFHPRYGYLTACPTNVGTGMRVSVMAHLPALRLTGELEKVGRAAKEMRLAIRGLYGEGTDALGDFFQISNQTTLGRSEEQILDEFSNFVIPKIIDFEHAARQALIENRAYALDDKVHRAMGLLQNARLMSSNEAMQFLSHVRMGVNVGRLPRVDLKTVNELFLYTQPAHLQRLRGERLNGEERSIARAELIRDRLSLN